MHDRVARGFAAVHESGSGTKRTSQSRRSMSAFESKADKAPKCRFVRLWHISDMDRAILLLCEARFMIPRCAKVSTSA